MLLFGQHVVVELGVPPEQCKHAKDAAGANFSRFDYCFRYGSGWLMARRGREYDEIGPGARNLCRKNTASVPKRTVLWMSLLQSRDMRSESE